MRSRRRRNQIRCTHDSPGPDRRSPIQVDAQIAESAFTTTDLVTVLVGQNDILAQYAQYPTVGVDQLGKI